VAHADLLAVGEAFEDYIFLGLERLPKAGEEVKTSAFVRTLGGGAVITATAASRLGMSTELVSGLSDDAEARTRAEGIRTTNLRLAGEPPAITAALSTRTNRSFVTFNGVNDHLEPRLLDAVREVNARHAHFALYPRDCSRWADVIARLRARGITTSWDFGWNEGVLADRGFTRLVNGLDYVFVNEQEAALYTRRLTLADALAAWSSHPYNVILKLGAKGSHWIGGGNDVAVPAVRVKTLDTTGAGDAFNGGFLVALLRGHSAKTCLRLGNFVGGMATRAAGGLDALPLPNEVPESLRHALEPKSGPKGPAE
jgi:sugar/nucleoside kinase (ribokinase family)